ncbi:hypothetical protein IMSAGC006_02312 [Muribaculaceae bacterium]|nr:hypothetical protein IMSAGC006_02312 [Muribaculaceae bacterium]
MSADVEHLAHQHQQCAEFGVYLMEVQTPAGHHVIAQHDTLLTSVEHAELFDQSRPGHEYLAARAGIACK